MTNGAQVRQSRRIVGRHLASCFYVDNPSGGTVPSLHIQFYACSVPSRLLRCLTLLELQIPQGHYLILNTLLVPLNQFSSFKSP